MEVSHSMFLGFANIVNLKSPIQLDEKGQVAGSSSKPVIRTMKGDMAILQKQGAFGLTRVASEKKQSISGIRSKGSETETRGTTPPPEGLPVVRPDQPAQMGQSLDMASDKAEERIKKEMEIKQRIEETRKKLEEEREKARIAQRQAEEKRLRETEGEGMEKARIEKERIEKEKEKAEKGRAKKAKAEKKELKRMKDTGQGVDWKFVLTGLVVILIIGGIGGFFYWKYYIEGPPLAAVHKECQEYQCIEVEGEGEDKCSVSNDCLPPEPTVPTSLISAKSVEIIEINKGQENLFPDKLKTVLGKSQEKDTFKQILAQLVDGPKKEYFSFDKLISALELKLLSDIVQSIAESDINGGNYTLFSYSQEEGNRLGLAMGLKGDANLTDKLRDWEKDIKDDLKSIFLAVELPESATQDFQDNVHQEKDIRFINFPNPDLSIDYAVVSDKLIITTSRDSMFAAIDALLVVEAARATSTSTATSTSQ